MKKKVLSILVGMTMVSSLLAGCGGSSTAATTAAAATTVAAAETTVAAAAAETTKAASGEKMTFQIVSKGFQHQYWQAVKKGAEQKAAELGVEITFVGPNTESDIADQVQMLNNAISKKPNAIGLAALDTKACLDAINEAKTQSIPIVGFDSGVPDAPEGAVVANASTDNYAAGELAAVETYKLIKDRIANATGSVRIGVAAQDATAESIVNRGLGFIDKISSLIIADGKTVNVEGNDRYVTDSKATKTKDANVTIEVSVPAAVDATLSQTDVENLMNKDDTICIYGSNQHTGEALVNANEKLQKLGTGDDKIVGVAFDSGSVIKGAITSGVLAGAVTQAPVAMGEALVDLLYKSANGEKVSDVDTGCQWYTKDTIANPEIAQNLYD